MPNHTIVNLSETDAILQHYMTEVRDEKIQLDQMRFRKNLERIAFLIGYEISKKLSYKDVITQTPLGKSNGRELQDTVVIASILRAGLTMHNGLLDLFDKAENAFISAYREAREDHVVNVKVEYKAGPSLTNKILIIADPMLATGQSLWLAYLALIKNGQPKKIFVVAALASEEAIHFLKQNLPENIEIWVGDIDPLLNEKSYIVPGLGDAGDLAYGTKI